MRNEVAWQEKLAEWLYRKIGGQDGGLSWGALPHAEKRRYRGLVTEFEEEQGLVEEHKRDMEDLERDMADDRDEEIERADERAEAAEEEASTFEEEAKAFEEDLDKERRKHQETIDKLEETRHQLRDAQSQLLKARESAGLSDDELERARSAAYKRGYRAGRKRAAADAEEAGE